MSVPNSPTTTSLLEEVIDEVAIVSKKMDNLGKPDYGEDSPMSSQDDDFTTDEAIIAEELADKKQQIIIPSFRKKIKEEEKTIASQKIAPKFPKKKGISLAELLKNNVKQASSAKPMDPNSIEGQREMIAKRDRDMKAKAKSECIEKFTTIENQIVHWNVSLRFCILPTILSLSRY